MNHVVVARQPIFTPNLEVHGYELLFRGTEEDDEAIFQDADLATASVMLTAFLDIGTQRVVGDRRAFINCTRAFIVGEALHALPPGQFVIEVGPDVPVDAAVLAGLQTLSSHGFQIALDKYVGEGPMRALLDVADLVKLDCSTLGVGGVERQIQGLEGWGGAVVAQTIETDEVFKACRDLGADFFQGYFLMRPQLVAGQRVPANRLTLLRVLAEVNDPDTGLEELGQVLEQDVGLAYTLLRHANSVLYGLPRRVDKVRDVSLLLGLDRIRALASLLLLSQLGDKPQELLSTALIRAKMCELLASGEDGVGELTYFSTGLFSTLDALLDTPLPGILDYLPLVNEITTALLGKHQTLLRRSLECVLAYEQGDWAKVTRLGLALPEVGGAYLSALDYAAQVEQQMRADP